METENMYGNMSPKYVTRTLVVLTTFSFLLSGCGKSELQQRRDRVAEAHNPTSNRPSDPQEQPQQDDSQNKPTKKKRNKYQSASNEIDGPVPTVDITAPAGEDRINILAWNVESDGNDPASIANQIEGMKGFNLFAFSEVLGNSSADLYEQAAGKHWGNVESILSSTGRRDRLLFLVNTDVFEIIKAEELQEFNVQNKYRAPHAVTLKHKATETVFLVLNNHLARGNEDNRQLQADGLREWARSQTLPILAVGDYNFDYVFESKQGNPAFTKFMRDGIWKWVQPEEMVDSNWFDGDGDQIDDYPGSILDFAFVAGPAKDWNATCRVLQWEGDFPDNANTSDHRPLELSVQIR